MTFDEWWEIYEERDDFNPKHREAKDLLRTVWEQAIEFGDSPPPGAAESYVAQVDIIRDGTIVVSQTRKPSDSSAEFAKRVERAITGHHASSVGLTWHCGESGPKWASQVRRFIEKASAT